MTQPSEVHAFGAARVLLELTFDYFNACAARHDGELDTDEECDETLEELQSFVKGLGVIDADLDKEDYS